MIGNLEEINWVDGSWIDSKGEKVNPEPRYPPLQLKLGFQEEIQYKRISRCLEKNNVNGNSCEINAYSKGNPIDSKGYFSVQFHKI